MADDADQAQAFADAATERAIKARVDTATVKGTALCIECDDPIPAARRKANPAAKRCIDCQEDFENGAHF